MPFCNFIDSEKNAMVVRMLTFLGPLSEMSQSPLEFDTQIELFLHRIEEIAKLKIFWRWDGDSGKSGGRICWVREEKRIETNL